MARAVFDDYLKEITHQRAIWEKKPVVRKMYHHRYEKVVRALSPPRPGRAKDRRAPDPLRTGDHSLVEIHLG